MFYESEMRKRMSANGEACTSTPIPLDAKSEAERLERKSLVLWRRPWKTFKYSMLELYTLFVKLGLRLLDLRFLASVLILFIIYKLPGPHAKYMQLLRNNLGFGIYWLGLGLLSSVGFGTGLHTFLLYLGPHIASVTLAAYECHTLDFPTPPYPDQKTCPKEPYARSPPDMWNILAKVRIETLLWGVGTALGELPPYFMARAARLSDKNHDESLQQRRGGHSNIIEKSKHLVERVVLRIGFLGILLCASVPNPLFDLAGVACGHFLVPFWKFFVATLIGKALFKANIQQLIVIVAFSEDLVGILVDTMGQVPLIGLQLQTSLQNLLSSTKRRMHHKSTEDSITGFNLVAYAFQLIALVIVSYFVMSLLNALAQRHCLRLQLLNNKDKATEGAEHEVNANFDEAIKASPRTEET